MASVCGLVVIKEMAYRDNPNEQWSNKYWLTGTPPDDPNEWKALFDQLVADEVALYSPSSKVVGGIGYDDNTENANSVWAVDLTALGAEVPGQLVVAQSEAMAGDQAGLVQWRTSRKSTRGKWIYLRKYFHHGGTGGASGDTITTATQAAYDHFAVLLLQGSAAHGRRIRSQFFDEVLQNKVISPWVTTRTLKRRGKRP